MRCIVIVRQNHSPLASGQRCFILSSLMSSNSVCLHAWCEKRFAVVCFTQVVKRGLPSSSIAKSFGELLTFVVTGGQAVSTLNGQPSYLLEGTWRPSSLLFLQNTADWGLHSQGCSSVGPRPPVVNKAFAAALSIASPIAPSKVCWKKLENIVEGSLRARTQLQLLNGWHVERFMLWLLHSARPPRLISGFSNEITTCRQLTTCQQVESGQYLPIRALAWGGSKNPTLLLRPASSPILFSRFRMPRRFFRRHSQRLLAVGLQSYGRPSLGSWSNQCGNLSQSYDSMPHVVI